MLTDEEVARVMRESREYIAEHGWARGTMRTFVGKVCAVGGLIYSQQWAGLHDDAIRPEHQRDLTQCSDVLMQVVPREGRASFRSVPDWNDDYYTNEQEVLDVFAKAEKVALGVSPADV